jgi:predicted AAA+ superfamily ATPase
MERDIFEKLRQWKIDANRKPLLLQGARQIGKTWVMREFGRREFKYVAEFNVDEVKELKQVFARTKDPQRLIMDLSLYVSVPILPEETLIIIDEIQESEDALNVLKYFAEKAPEYVVIAAGSLLGVAVKKKQMTVPVGKVHVLKMYPLTFKEFLREADYSTYKYIDELHALDYLPEIILTRLIDQYRRYTICGGMPEAAVAMLEGRGMSAVDDILDDILQLYQLDFSKYATPVEVNRISAIWNSLPSQLSKENRQFIYSVVRPGARAREYEDSLIWLEQAGLIHKVYNVSTPKIPLKVYEELSAFKIYALDCGLLRRLAHLAPEVILGDNDNYKEFKGALAENMALLALLSQFKWNPNYWASGNEAEVDFIVENEGNIIPIEIKSGSRISGKSLAEYRKKYQPNLLVRFSLNNMQYNDGMLSLPLPLADWLKKIFSFVKI